MVNESLKQIQDLEQNITECNYYINNLQHDEYSIDILENMIKDVKKTLMRNTLTNIVNIIEKTVEDGTKNFEGVMKQFNVHSLHVSKDDEVYLVTREVLGVDFVDKKFILDDNETFINFKNVKRIY